MKGKLEMCKLPKKDEASNSILPRKVPHILEILDDDMVLSCKDVAELLYVHVETVRRWFRSGKIRTLSPSSHYKVLGADLKEFFLEWYFNGAIKKEENDLQ
jgi:excisionase family DNA binding protein